MYIFAMGLRGCRLEAAYNFVLIMSLEVYQNC